MYIRQTNFLGGELAPLLWGRTDLDLFGRGLRRMRNFFPTKHGAAMSRPGTRYVADVKSGAKAGLRLVPFVFSDDETFVLEVGRTASDELYFRFHSNGEQLEYTSTVLGSGIFEFLTGITTTSDLSKMKYAQTGNALVLTHPDWPARELVRLANWAYADALEIHVRAEAAALAAGNVADISGGSAAGVEAAYKNAYIAVWQFEGMVTGSVTRLAYDAALAAGDVAAANAVTAGSPVEEVNAEFSGGFFYTYELSLRGVPRWRLSALGFVPKVPYFAGGAGSYPVLLEPLPTIDLAHPGKEWQYAVSLTVQDTETGRIFETSAYRINRRWDGVELDDPTALNGAEYLITPLAVYPDQPMTISRSTHRNPDWTHVNLADNSYREICWNIYRGRAQLMGLVGTATGTVFVDTGSEPDYSVQPLLGTNPFTITDYAAASVTENPSAVAFFQNRLSFLATPKRPGGVFLSAVGNYLNFDRHELLPVSGEALFFELAARKKETGIHLVSHQKLIIGTRSSVWSFGGAGGAPLDFDSVEAKVIDEVGMSDVVPLIVGGLVLFVRTKGFGARALQFNGNYGTYNGADISSHSDHLFVGNSVDHNDVVTNKEIIDWTYAEDPWGVVWAVRADGLLLSLTVNGDQYSWARHDRAPAANADGTGATSSYRAICSVPEGDEDAVYVLVERVDHLGNTVVRVERMTSRVRRDDVEDDCCLDEALRWEGVPTKTLNTAGGITIGDLGQFEGEHVYVIGKDNAPQGPFLIEEDNLELPVLPTANSGANVVLFIGTAFTPELESLDVANGDLRTKQKTTVKIGVEVEQTRGLLAGQDFEHLKEWPQRDVATGFNPTSPATQLVRMPVSGSWGDSGRMAIRQALPLPVTITALVREVRLGDS